MSNMTKDRFPYAQYTKGRLLYGTFLHFSIGIFGINTLKICALVGKFT